MKELTLARIKNTDFKVLFEKLISRSDISRTEYRKLLTLAVIFINQKDDHVSRLGYRILLIYSNQTHDYKPLYDIALNKGLIPIVKSIESMQKYKEVSGTSFFNLFYSSFCELYKRDAIYLSEQQQELYSFFGETQKETVAVIAPTSYGKSELIVSALENRTKGNICIVVPTKALLAQTKKRLLNANISTISKVITHPDMYLDGEENITAVLTQERLLRLLRKQPTLSFDMVFIDEAHNLLEHDDRSILLASAISILEKRNERVVFKFLTPFLVESSNLNTRYTNYLPKVFRITEYIKTERLYLYDFRSDRQMKLYDQFLDEFFWINDNNYVDDIELILRHRGEKNIIYLNKPSDIELFSSELCSRIANVTSDKIKKACGELSKYLHGDYFLITCIEKGIIYHHGSVPDNVRTYIEYLYSDEDTMQFVVTSSTLLEGVNLPADRLFLLDNKKGQGKLNPSQFKNLIGRICRFKDIFTPKGGDLKKLEPSIFLIGSNYISKNANLEDFLKDSTKVDKKIKDDPTNVLLENVDITKQNREHKETADEFLENFEPVIIKSYARKYAQTQIGKLCFLNGITEIDVMLHEENMQTIVDSKKNKKINTLEELFELFSEVFLHFFKEGDSHNNLRRLSYPETRRFYQMFLNWRMKSASYSEMINSFLRYWEKLEANTLIYVGRWGDIERDGFKKLWSNITEKNNKQRINLAIVRIKEEQDFLDNILIKYIEVLNDLGFLESEFYERIKYGTSEKAKIILVKNGFSISLANLIISKYGDFVEIDLEQNVVNFKPEIVKEMSKNNENDILIFEVKYNIKLFSK